VAEAAAGVVAVAVGRTSALQDLEPIFGDVRTGDGGPSFLPDRSESNERGFNGVR
jgi:hypothetical protein